MKYRHDVNRTARDLEMKRQLRPWMEVKGIPPDTFDDLNPHDKVLLHEQIYLGTSRSSYEQLRKLRNNLRAACGRRLYLYVAGRGEPSWMTSDAPSYDELLTFFSSRTPNEQRDYLKRF